MGNYYAAEVGLTKHTKKLWNNKPVEVCLRGVDTKIERFQSQRLFAVIRQNNSLVN